MNNLSIGLLLAAGLFFIEVSPATAHSGIDSVRAQDRGHHAELLRRHEMPRRLRRNAEFRHWYRRSPLSRFRQISWNQLFEVYRWERRYFERRYSVAYDDDRRHRDRDRNRRPRRSDD